MYTVYVLFSEYSKKIYIGCTSDIEKRLVAHNHPLNKGWTKSFQPWVLIYKEEYKSKSEALIREKQLKSAKGREFIRNSVMNNWN